MTSIGDVVIDLEPYYWMVVLGGIACFAMGFGIGANDVANNVGSAIGAGSITFRVAVVLAAIFELIGAVGLGASVTDSIKSGIIDPAAAAARPDLTMWANLSALIAGTVWLIGSSVVGMPVSTTHTCIGCLLGAGLAMPHGYEYIDWQYFGTVVFSWFTSPVLSGLLTAMVYPLYRTVVLRKDAEVAVPLARKLMWPTMFVTCSVFGIFFMVKTPATKHWASENFGPAIGVGFLIGLICMALVTPLIDCVARRNMTKAGMDFTKKDANVATIEEQSHAGRGYDSSSSSDDDDSVDKISAERSDRSLDEVIDNATSLPSKKSSKQGLFDDDDNDEQELDCNDKIKKKWYSLPWFMDLKAEALNNDIKAAQQRENAEQFSPVIEKYFSYLQIITASMACLVHGANDVANATAPFSSIHGLYSAGGFTEEVPTPYWILFLGGSAIGFGVFFLGHKVIMSMGFKLAAITPSRGFCMELGSTIVMVIGSYLGIPLSTTHCKVGGTIAIALIEPAPYKSKTNCCGRCNPKALNMKFVIKIVISWVATVVVGALMAGAIFALGVYSPGVDLPASATFE